MDKISEVIQTKLFIAKHTIRPIIEELFGAESTESLETQDKLMKEMR